MALDEDRLEAFTQRFAADLGAALHATTVVLGDKLGLYRALAALGPTDAASLAAATGCDPRLVQEWLDAQSVSGYCHHSTRTATYWLSPEQAAVLADPSSPSCVVASMTAAASTSKDEEKLRAAFRTGQGLAWHDHHPDLFHGSERLVSSALAVDVVGHCIPALHDVPQILQFGADVADVGCGHGTSTIRLAIAYPRSTITGFDRHEEAVDVARQRAAEAGVADRVRFEVADAHEFPGEGYDLVCVVDTFHELGDPRRAACHIRSTLGRYGTWMLVEPMAGGRTGVDAGLDPVGRIFYAASTTICTPAAQADGARHALGSQVPDETYAAIAAEAGFSRFRRAAETSFTRIFEIRP